MILALACAQDITNGSVGSSEGKCRDEAGAAAETSLTETIRRHDTGLTALNAEDGLTADRNVEDEETGPLLRVSFDRLKHQTLDYEPQNCYSSLKVSKKPKMTTKHRQNSSGAGKDHSNHDKCCRIQSKAAALYYSDLLIE